ncbi:hypothetical protein F2Q68_00025129 [Brassica cretica]|uniref:Uncharacterized protein n=2 Tax=Brassica cretica TaxID=69181 RepID=A0A8S9I7M3_BRACR|nr:hypothetical protein F2Q68_00025129 [Brassica cretica]KAF3579020.1 hypothetical protein DY000_02030576 [Brassica cretica]
MGFSSCLWNVSEIGNINGKIEGIDLANCDLVGCYLWFAKSILFFFGKSKGRERRVDIISSLVFSKWGPLRRKRTCARVQELFSYSFLGGNKMLVFCLRARGLVYLFFRMKKSGLVKYLTVSNS